MELITIKTALEFYLNNCADADRGNVLEALVDCDELISRGVDENDTVHIVSTTSLTGLLNCATYDDYGRLARLTDNVVSFDHYANRVRYFTLRDLTDDVLQLGYYFLRDLWYDNERDGYNNPDGTFKH
jgi:hypothetical protein